MFYVYEWFIIDTNEIFYVGKGCKDRYKDTRSRNKMFNEFYKRFNCNTRIIKTFKQNRPCKGHICKYDNQQPSINLND